MVDKDLEQRTLAVRDEVCSIDITDNVSFQRMATFLLEIKSWEKKVDAYWEEEVSGAHKQWKRLVAKRAEMKKPLEEAEAEAKKRMAVWEQLEAARVADENRKAQAEATRLAAENVLAEAQAMEAAGDKEGAYALLSSPLNAVVIPISGMAKAAGVAFRDSYDVEVDDLLELVKAVAAQRVPVQAVIPNMTFLSGMARSMKGEIQFPGCRIVKKRSVAAGGRG